MHSEFMKRALDLANEALLEGEVPVGAVIVKDGRIIAEGRNRREQKKSAISHAEIEAIRAANEQLCDWRLDGCTMYVTLEPCLMCTGAILNSRISCVVFGAYDLNAGCIDSAVNINDLNFCKLPTVYGGICEDECKAVLDKFFESVR